MSGTMCIVSDGTSCLLQKFKFTPEQRMLLLSDTRNPNPKPDFKIIICKNEEVFKLSILIRLL